MPCRHQQTVAARLPAPAVPQILIQPLAVPLILLQVLRHQQAPVQQLSLVRQQALVLRLVLVHRQAAGGHFELLPEFPPSQLRRGDHSFDGDGPPDSLPAEPQVGVKLDEDAADSAAAQRLKRKVRR